MDREVLDLGVARQHELREMAVRVSETPRQAGVLHAVIGGVAVAAHVGRTTAELAHNTKDLDLPIYRVPGCGALAAHETYKLLDT